MTTHPEPTRALPAGDPTPTTPETPRSARPRATVAVAVTAACLVALLPSSTSASTEVSDEAADQTVADPTSAEAEAEDEAVTEPRRVVRLRVGAKPVTRVSTAATRPRELLRERGVRVRHADRVRLRRSGTTVSGDRVLRQGDLVRVVRITRRVRIERVPVPRQITRRAVTTLPAGRKKVVRPGRRGVQQVTRVRVRKNGEFSHRRITRTTVREPRARRVLVGRRFPTVRGTGHLNWRALAHCESTGNPRAVNAAGYYGLYQFDARTWRSVGGTGLAHQASGREQTHRAQRLYKSRGRSPWPHCGRLL